MATANFRDALRKQFDNVDKNDFGSNPLTWRAPVNKDGSPCQSKVRILPYHHAEDGNPFQEVHFFFDIGRALKKKDLVDPLLSYGIDNPLSDFVDDIRQDDFNLWRALNSGMRINVPVLVRGEEDKGVRFWGFGKKTFKAIFHIIMNNEDYEDVDVTDPLEGRDLIIITSKDGGAQYYETGVSFREKSTPVIYSAKNVADKAAIKDVLASVPNIREVFPPLDNEELTQLIDRLGKKVEEGAFAAEGTSRSGGDKETSTKEDKLDAAADKVKSTKSSDDASTEDHDAEVAAQQFSELL